MKTDFSQFDASRVAHVAQEKKKNAEEILNGIKQFVVKIDFTLLVYPEAETLKTRLTETQDAEEKETINKRLSKFRVTERQKYVCIIDELLSLAAINNYGLAKNGAFIYLYNGRYWEELDKNLIANYLGEIAEDMGIKKHDARQFIVKENLLKQFLCSSFQPLPDPGNEVRINIENGTYVINGDQRELREHRQEDFLKYQLPFAYDPSATCPMFQRYLDRVLPDKSAQDVLAEYLGYCFTKKLKLEKALILYGSGANGKGIFFDVTCALLGKENVSNFQMRHLCDDTGYYRAKLCNKIVNYSSEKGEDFDGELFKTLCSGEPVPARLPYGEPFEITSYAKIIFNANSLPVPKEMGEAFFRRFLIVPFSVTIPPEERDPDLATKITGSELSGIFNWVLAGLDRILTNRGFSPCKSIDEALDNYRYEADSVSCFLQEEGYISSYTERIVQKNFYACYRDFCMDNGYRPCSNKVFRKRLEGNGITSIRSNGMRYVYVEKKQEGVL